MDSPVFRSGLRRLLYPATDRMSTAAEEAGDALLDSLQRLDLLPDDCRSLPRERRTFHGRFVDVTSGEVLIEQVDVEIPGPVPFRWSRFWRSNKLTAGSFGYGWRHAYDVVLLEDRPGRRVIVRLPDNRAVIFPLVAEGAHFVHRAEKLRLSYDTRGYRLQVAEELGYRFAMNASGCLCQLISIDKLHTPFRIRLSYSHTGHLQYISDDFQRIIAIITDSLGRISRLEISGPDLPVNQLPVVAYEYDETQNLKGVVVHGQRVAQFMYQHNRIICLTDQFRHRVFFTYEKAGHHYRCQAIKWDNSPVLFRFHYLLAEGRTRVTDAAGNVRQYMHEAGVVHRLVSEGGQQRVWFFNEFGELLSEQDAFGNTSFYGYDNQGNMISAAWPDGGKMLMHYNDEGQLTALTDRAEGTWSWTYNEAGQLLSCTDPVGAETTFAYENKGLLTERIRTGEGGVKWAYDRYANRKMQTSATGDQLVWVYDMLGRLNESSQLNVTSMEPLAAAKPTGADVHKPVSPYLPMFDDDGQLIRLGTSERLNWQFIRDAAGRVREYTRPDGCSTQFHYNAAGRLTDVLFGDGSWHHYAYRPDGWLMEAATPTTHIQFERDPLGRIVAETAGQTTVKTVYDKAGRRVGMQSSAEAVVAYAYNDLGLLTAQTHPQWQLRFTHDRQGRLTECLMPGGLRSRWQYESGSRPGSHQLFWGSRLQAARSQTYLWEQQRLVRLQDARFGTAHIRYDRFNEPVEAIGSAGWTERWVAQRSRYQQLLLRPDTQVIERGWQVIAVGAMRFYYDSEGYLREKQVADKVWQFQWHESGVLQQVTRPDQKRVTFVYDAIGRRIEKSTADQKVCWTWDGNRLLHEWYHRTGSEPIRLTWYTAGRGEATMIQLGGDRYSLVSNYAGQPLSLHNEQGEPVWEWQWCLFGKKRQLTGPAHGHTLLGPGPVEDLETGLMYADFRYYDLETGLPVSPGYSSPAGWARSGWEPPHAPESFLSAARYIRAY